ncbi:MAG: DUF1549 domain-containing protein [Pirellulaceae bacterium]
MRNRLVLTAALVASLAAVSAVSAEQETLPSIDQRFAQADATEVPNFQRHVVPLFGRLGCNGRSCHGSFQGRGGFQLSLFGYDFKADHDALFDEKSPRVDVAKPLESLILVKPTDEFEHEGGERYKKGGWEYHVLSKWIESGAKFEKSEIVKLEKLEVTPAELIFNKAGEQVQLKAVAVWADGVREDVTALCRFQSNDDLIAAISESGQVTAGEIGDTHVVVSYDNGVVPIPVLRPVSELAGAKYPKVSTPTKVDELVVNKLRKLGIVPSETCTDAEFLRRVSLDLAGTLPTATQVEKFLADKSPNKRSEKIDELLASPGYAGWWTTKLCDYTGNNEQQVNNVLPRVRGSSASPTQAWYDWIYERVAENAPYDELVEGIVAANSRREGQSYTEYCQEMSEICRPDSDKSFADMPSMPFYWARRDFREVEAQTITFAYAFMGVRIQCAQCHKHPFDQWTKDDFAQFQNFFGRATLSQNAPREDRDEYDAIIKKLGVEDGLRGNQVRQKYAEYISEGKTVPFPELTVSAPRGGRNRGQSPSQTAQLLGGEPMDLSKVEDPRQPLMDWLRSKDNPYFAKAFVNRVWANYFNVGIVEPPDDMSLANAPSNKELLDYLAQGFIDSGFDMKWVHREITNSRTYQLSWKTNETNEADERNFSRSVPRRMPAEIAYDAIQIATASDDRAAGFQKELENRALGIAGAGNRNQTRGPLYALTVFGRSARESNCDCDRSMESSLLQTVFLQNDSEMLAMIDDRNSWVSQMARELKISPPPSTSTAQQPNANERAMIARVQQRMDALQKKADRLKKEGQTEEAEKLQQQVRNMMRQVERYRQQRGGQRDQAEVRSTEKRGDADKVDVKQLVEQAYLRTVSRYPDASELDRSREFVEGSSDTITGLRDLMWALVNTKEFILNH